MAQRSKSTLFLIEQLIVVAVFAICAAACISILTAAYFYTVDSAAASNAVIKAESAAEIFKATGGDHIAVGEFMGGTVMPPATDGGAASSVAVYFNKQWQPCSISEAGFILNLVVDDNIQFYPEFSIITGNLTVRRITGEFLISFPLTARSGSGVMSYG